jgi:uncharacterized protein with ATP-grasp and redox domains/cytoskeletal protein CcmA (bactofilin family)
MIPGMYKLRELENICNPRGENMWEERKEIILSNIEKLTDLMKEQESSSPDLDYIIEHFKKAVGELLENEKIKELTITEFDELFLWLSRKVSNKLYDDIKEKQNEKGKEYYKKIKPMIDKILDKEGEEKALEYALKYATFGNMLEHKYFVKRLLTKRAFKNVDKKCLIQEGFFENLMKDLEGLGKIKDDEGMVKYYIDNAGEFYLDLLAIQLMLKKGLKVVIFAQGQNVNNDDLSISDVNDILLKCLEEEGFEWLKDYYSPGNPETDRLRVISNNSKTYGVNLNYQNKEHRELREDPNSITLYKGGVNANYSTCNQKEEANSYHLSAIKQEDQKAIAYGLDFVRDKIVQGNLMFYSVLKEQKGYNLNDLLEVEEERRYFKISSSLKRELEDAGNILFKGKMREFYRMTQELFDNAELRKSLGIELRNGALIGKDVQLGDKVKVEKGAIILGRTKILEGKIGKGAVVVDCVAENLEIAEGSLAVLIEQLNAKKLEIKKGQFATNVFILDGDKDQGIIKKIRVSVGLDFNLKRKWDKKLFTDYLGEHYYSLAELTMFHCFLSGWGWFS